MIIQICVGSACHLKGSEKLVGLFEDALKNMTSKRCYTCRQLLHRQVQPRGRDHIG